MKSEEIKVRSHKRNEMIDVTQQIRKIVDNWHLQDASLLIFVPHTTAAVTINEHADPSVQHDILLGLEQISPDRREYRHLEGNSDAHLKSSLVGCSQIIKVISGKLLLGRWQGIFFCEFDGPRTRNMIISQI